MTQNMLPAGRPRMTLADLTALVRAHGLDPAAAPLFVVGIRGYYEDTMGAAGANDRGIYDDALFLVSPNVFMALNANTDPSRVRLGSGTGAAKGMAALKPGLYRAHRFDLHKGQYLALCQRAGNVTVVRDGSPPYEDTGSFGINIHKGGFNTTSSEGCQTIHPSQWGGFIGTAEAEARRLFGDRWRATTIPYLLVDNRELAAAPRGTAAVPAPPAGPGLAGVAEAVTAPAAAPGELQPSEACLALCQEFEGLHRLRGDGMIESYPDPATGADPWTIGYGTTGPDVRPGTVWTRDQATARFRDEIANKFGAGVRRLLGTAATTQGQFDALVSFAYNVGLDEDADTQAEGLGDSTLLRKHLAGDYAAAAAEFGKWINANGRRSNGLVRRRAAEAELYRGAA